MLDLWNLMCIIITYGFASRHVSPLKAAFNNKRTWDTFETFLRCVKNAL